MKPIANPARFVDVIRKAAVLAVAADSRGLGASSRPAGTELDLRRSSRCRDNSHAFASDFMYFLGDGQGGAVAAIATLQRVVPFHGFSMGAVRSQAARWSAWLR
jgi:hypothetical protein